MMSSTQRSELAIVLSESLKFGSGTSDAESEQLLSDVEPEEYVSDMESERLSSDAEPEGLVSDTESEELPTDAEPEEPFNFAQSATNWILNDATSFLSSTKANMVTDAPKSELVRFRWFEVKIKGVQCTVGLNIHYLDKNGRNSWGGAWVVRQNDKSMNAEFHPSKAPRHKFTDELKRNIININYSLLNSEMRVKLGVNP